MINEGVPGRLHPPQEKGPGTRDAFQSAWLAPVATPFLNLERQFQVVLHRDKHLSPGLRAILALCGVDGG